jgi:hypothetical protein
MWWSNLRLHAAGIEEERRQFEDGQDFDPRRVRLATVHTRQDVAPLYHLVSWAVYMLVVLTALAGAHVRHHW